MAHAKTQIRDQAVVQTTGLATTGARVYKARVYPFGAEKLPGLNWRTGDERKVLDGDTIGRRELWELELYCEGRAKPGDGVDLDALLDTIQAEVQAAIMTDPPTLGNRVLWIELQTARKRQTGELELPVGIVELLFVCRYWILAGDPETLIYAA